jgi:NADH-quinone oxidoreductase subunit D
MTSVTDQPEELLLGVGLAAHLAADRELVLHDGHPSGHAAFQLRVGVIDAVVTSADPQVGFMHRGSEKLFESRDYRQIMMLANRHDWLSAFSSELGIALVLETATGIVPPERATWIRMLLAEANRAAAHLSFLASVIDDADHRQQAWDLREQLLHAQEVVTGGRIHPMFTRIGGVAGPISRDALAEYAAIVAVFPAVQRRVEDAVLTHAKRLAGVAVLSHVDAVGYGTSGVVARASGVDLDLRRDDPYLAYDELADLVRVPVATAGDACTRYELLVGQLQISVAIMSACVDRLRTLGDGPVNVALPKTVRAPEGTSYGWIEGPLGPIGFLLASVGDSLPWRLKIRSASFANAQSMTTALVGTPIELLADAVESFFFVVGDIDR